MIPKIVHQTAKTKLLTPEENRLRDRIQRIMPDWRLELWDDADNARIMQEFFPDYHERFVSIRRGVVRADIARLAFLHAYGGLYLDTDYKVLRKFDEQWLQYDCVLPVSRDDDPASPDFRVCNSIMASAPRYPIWGDFIRHLFDEHQLDKVAENAVEGITGPEGLTSFLLANRDRYPEVVTPERRHFHPLITMKGFSYDRRHPSFGAHLCWGSWRSKSQLRNVKNFAVRKITSFTS